MKRSSNYTRTAALIRRAKAIAAYSGGKAESVAARGIKKASA